MKSDELLDAIGEAKDEYVHDVRNGKVKKMPGWAKWTSAIAACLVLTIGVSLFFGGMGGSAGGGGDADLNYMDYIGPVFPMTIQGDNPGITAVRNVNYDFSPYITYQDSYEDEGEITYYDRYHTEAIVTDSYTLTNSTGIDQTLTLLYLQPGSLHDYADGGESPIITVNGEPVNASFHPGPYTGSFEGAWGSEESGSLNLDLIENFEGYASLLSDGSYQDSAFDDFPILDQTVIVYRLSDYIYTADNTAPNPTIEMSFQIDFDKTHVFTYGMNGGQRNIETGYLACHKGSIQYDPNQLEHFREPNDAFVILMGEDISGYEIQGYRNGGCNEGEELDDMDCTVTRYESTLGQILSEICKEYMEFSIPFVYGEETTYGADLYCALAAELLETHGIIGEAPAERYDWGSIEDLISATHTDPRVNYFAFQITIPAGESIAVDIVMRKDASVDFYGEGKDVDGYDMAIQLGSNLTFTDQTASITGYEEIEIISQNFGFDLANGITSVTLELTQDHYWMQIRKVRND